MRSPHLKRSPSKKVSPPSSLEGVASSEPACTNCPLNGRPRVTPHPPPKNTKLIILGEAPGENEVAQQEFFVGRSGELLNLALNKLKIPRHQCYITNACLCWPGFTTLPPAKWKQAIACCRSRLLGELAHVPSKTILALGGRAQQAAFGKPQITKWMGAPTKGIEGLESYTVISTVHPAFCLRGRDKGTKVNGRAHWPVLVTHIARAWRQATSTLPVWKWPRFELQAGPQLLASLKSLAKSSAPLYLDVESFGDVCEGTTVMCVGLSDGVNTIVSPWDNYHAGKWGEQPAIEKLPDGPEIKALIIRLLTTREIVAQNGQHDVLMFRGRGITIKEVAFDCLFAHAVVAPQLPHDLSFQACVETYAERWKEVFHAKTDSKGEAAFVKRDPLVLREYCAKDTWIMSVLRANYLRRLGATFRGQELFDRYQALGKLVIEMRAKGVQVDTSKFVNHRIKLRRRRKRAKWELRRIARKLHIKGWPTWQPSRPAHLKQLFFERLKATPTTYSEKTSEPKLDEEALQKLLSDSNAWVVTSARALLRYRRWSKLLRTYIDGLPMDVDNIVHPTWRCFGTITGRWSSQKPNVMNIPKPVKRKSATGKEITVASGLRDIFVAHDKGWVIEVDKAQLELRIIAMLAGDMKLKQAFDEGRDVHGVNTTGLFGSTDFTKYERDLAKRFVYGANYGGEDTTLWRNLVIDFPTLTLAKVSWMLQRWFTLHPEIKNWQQRILREARLHDYVEAPLSGRREYFFGAVEPNKVFNFPVQGTGADLLDPAILVIWKEIQILSATHIMFQVHDSVVVSTTEPEKAAEILQRAMDQEIVWEGQTWKFPSDMKIGKDWGTLFAVKPKPGEKLALAVRRAMRECSGQARG